ncbi:MAG: hypothetical protein MI919_38610 [Holophagales bacterium]|nr:hypothetical protein [Holophagales bacterium]
MTQQPPDDGEILITVDADRGEDVAPVVNSGIRDFSGLPDPLPDWLQRAPV